MNLDYPQDNDEEKNAERLEKLKEGFGVTLCAKQKDGEIIPLEDQIELAEKMDTSSVQFDFRNRTDEEIDRSAENLIKYRQEHPDMNLSIHGETPQIEAATLKLRNSDRTAKELILVQDLASESYTVHPPSINSKLFSGLPQETKDEIVGNYCSIFTEAIEKAVAAKKSFSLAIENMPNKGDEGSWGQTVDDIMLLIRKIESTLVSKGIDPTTAREYVGATLDINHALHDTETENYGDVLKSWFEGLGDYLKVIHLQAPSSIDRKFTEKCILSLELAARFNSNARLFMESKRNPETTEEIYKKSREFMSEI